MKKWCLIAIVLAMFCVCNAQTKRALLIVLQQYNPNEWSTIHAANDSLLLKPALLTQGFKASNIIIINDNKGRKNEILAAIAEFVKKCRRNDIIYFHFSGHGQSVADKSGDEDDGYDEAIVPIDAPSTFQEGGYQGELHIIDDTLHAIFNRIRDSIGKDGDLLISLDACYSGTAARMVGFSRGNPMPIASGAHIKQYPLGAPDSNKAIVLSRQDRAVVFTACTAYEEDREIADKEMFYGPLSYAMAECFTKMEKGIAYADLFLQVKMKMASVAKEQTPLMEGAGNKAVFNGQIIPYVKSFVPYQYQPNGRLYRLSYGQLHGFFPKTKVAVHELTTTNYVTVHPVTVGEVQSSDASSCVIKVERNMIGLDPEKKKFIITQQSFGEMRIAVRLDIHENNPLLTTLQGKLAAYPSISLVNDASAELILESNNKYLKKQSMPANYLQVSDSRGQSIREFHLDASKMNVQADSTVNTVIKYLFGNYLKQLQATSPRHKSEINFVLGEVCQAEEDGSVNFKEVPKNTYMQGAGYYEGKQGQCFRLEIKNKSVNRFYYTVILITPQNEVKFLTPDETETAAEKVLTGLKTKKEPSPAAFQIQPPPGKDVYKLIVTSHPLDLQLLMTSGIKNIPPKTASINALYDVLRAAGMGVKAPPPPKGDLDIKTFVLEIK